MKNSNVAPKKARAAIQVALTIASILVLNGIIGYGQAIPKDQKWVFYGKPLVIETAQAKEVTEEVVVPILKVEKKMSADRDKIDTLIEREFPQSEVSQARMVIWCESRYNAGAHNQNEATGDDSVGLGQINLKGNLFPGRLLKAQKLGYQGESTREALVGWLKVPENNIRYFASMQSASGWKPWACSTMVKDQNWKYRPQMLAFLER